ncbi:hypothetical protein SNOUR_37585 [Streptomyces noursei ATCC 11455]|nr:hypothetical protein SNOUR_37585 [Streptomyces noursei ATCC 11455]
MNPTFHSRPSRGRWIPLALTVALVSGCGPTGGPADSPTPSPPPSTAPPPLLPPPERVPGWHCTERPRLPDTVEVGWPVEAPGHRAAGPDGTSVLATDCGVLLLRI